MKERRLEILGILIVAVSLLVIISLFGYNSNEDPGISPNVRIENPLGILGLWIAYYFIKLGFGYMSFVLPILGIIWGVWFFTHKDFDAISRLSGYVIGAMILSSISFGAASLYGMSGMVGGLISGMFRDFLGIIGTMILLTALWLVLIRGYFGFSYYHPIRELLSKLKKKQDEKKLVTDEKNIEEEKRRHTQSLISKIDAQRSKEIENIDLNSGEGAEDTKEDSAEISETEDASDIANVSDESEQEVLQSDKIDNTSKNTDKDEESVDLLDDSNPDNIEETNEDMDIEVGEIIEEDEVELDEVQDRKAPKKAYQLPSADLLDNPSVNIQTGMSRDELVDRANFLQQSLETFGVVGKVVNVILGNLLLTFTAKSKGRLKVCEL